MEELLKGSAILIYLLSVISIINYEPFSKVQRISIIYAFTYGLTYTTSLTPKSAMALLPVMIFIFEEYLTDDKMKIVILYKWRYKLADFLFQAVFQYKILWVLVGILLRTWKVECMLNHYVSGEYLTMAKWGVTAVSMFFVFYLCIHRMYTEKEVYHTFSEMYRGMEQHPYYMVDFTPELRERLELVADMEDRLFFERKKSYHAASWEYIRLWFKRRWSEQRIVKKGKRKKSRRLRRLWRVITHIIPWLKRQARRGHSTIEMQLIRIMAYKEGLLLGRPKNLSQWLRVGKRKLYEVMFSTMFFGGLKAHLSKSLCKDLKHYREYLMVLYLYSVQSKVGKKTYRPLSEIYGEREMEKWPMECLFLTCLGLNSVPITFQRVMTYYGVVVKYGLDEEQIVEMVNRLNGIPDGEKRAITDFL